ncbi:MAG: DUF4159 domain-containing protein [Planctomycetota bacterium]|jgi:hypothetical protein
MLALAVPCAAQRASADVRLQHIPVIADAEVRATMARGQAALTKLQQSSAAPENSVGVRALQTLWALEFDRQPPTEENTQWLIAQQQDSGGWGFGSDHSHTKDYPEWTDILNTQLAVAALREAQWAGRAVPAAVFDKARIYCLTSQNADGGWGYTPPDAKPLRVRGASHGSATASALALLADCPPSADQTTTQRQRIAQARGLKWLTDQAALKRVPGWVWGEQRQWAYYVYCLHRFAAANGWQAPMARKLRDRIVHQLILRQTPDGRWSVGPDTLDETQFALLALSAARSGVLVNSLSLDAGESAQAANWVRHVSVTASRTYGWQAVTLKDNPAVIVRAPILYLRAGRKLALSSAWRLAMRRHVERGGCIVVAVSNYEPAKLRQAAKGLAKMLKHWQVIAMTEDHPVLSARHKLPASAADRLVLIGDGARVAAAVVGLSVDDHLAEQPGSSTRLTYELMDNLAMVATGQDPPAGRGPFVAFYRIAAPEPKRFVPLARIQHGGDWNVAPLAMKRLSETLASSVSIGVAPQKDVSFASTHDVPRQLLWLTGTQTLDLTRLEQANIKEWLKKGGLLFVDSATGDKSFFEDIKAMMLRLFGDGTFGRLPDDHPLITGSFAGGIGSDLRQVTYTSTVRNPPTGGELHGVTVNGQLAVIVSRYGVTSALEGAPILGAQTLSHRDAHRLATNVLLWTISPAAE